jgi:hypothetical protein
VTKINIEFPDENTEDNIMCLCSFYKFEAIMCIYYDNNEKKHIYLDFSFAESMLNKKVSYSNNCIKFNIYTDTIEPSKYSIIGVKVQLPQDWKITLKLTSTHNVMRRNIMLRRASSGDIVGLKDDYFAIITKKSINLQSIDFEDDIYKFHIDSDTMNKKVTEFLNIYICHMTQSVDVSLKEIYKHDNSTKYFELPIKKICFDETMDDSDTIILQFQKEIVKVNDDTDDDDN